MGYPMRSYSILLAVILIASPGVSLAQVDLPWLKIPSDATRATEPRSEDIQVSPQRVQELLSAGHGFAAALIRDEIHINQDGTREYRSVEARRFLSEQGAHSAGDLYFSVSPTRSTSEIVAAYVLTPSGSRVSAEMAAIQVINLPRARMFSDDRVVGIPFRSVRPGSTAVLVTRIRTIAGSSPLPWGTHRLLRLPYPVERLELTLTWDEGAPEPVLKVDDAELTCDRVGRRMRCWRDRIPASTMAPDAPNFMDVVPHVAMASPQSWRALSAAVAEMVDQQIRAGAPEPGAAARIVGSEKGHARQLAALHRFVADQIRYVAIVEGNHTVVPYPPRSTLERHFGDCKDKVTLFVALARQLGIDVYPVLVASGLTSPESMMLPSVSYFDHMVACADEAGGKRICFDPTIAHSPPGVLSVTTQGLIALRIGDSVDEPMVLDAGRFASLVRSQATISIECNGDAAYKSRWEVSGPEALSIRAFYGPQSNEDRARHFQAMFRQLVRGAQPVRISFFGIDTASESIAVELETSLEPDRHFQQRRRMTEWDPWLSLTLDVADPAEVGHPVIVPGVRLVSTISFELCPVQEGLPDGAELDLSTDFGSLRRTYRKSPRGIDVESILELPRAMLGVDEVSRFRRFTRELRNQSRVAFRMRGLGKR